MSKEVIAVDIDEVLFPFMPHWTAWHNETYGTKLEPEDFFSYAFEDVIGLSVPETMDRIHAFQALPHSHVEPLGRSREATLELSQQYELDVITARNPKFERVTRAWVEGAFPSIFQDVISIGHPYAVEKARTKAEVCRELGAVALIDDSPFHCNAAQAASVQALLFGDYPWNQTDELRGG